MSQHRDPGLQAERTQLAWERTAIGMLTVAGLLALRLPPHPAPADLTPPAGTLLLGLICAAIGWWRGRTVLARTNGRVVGAPAIVLVAGGGAVAIGLVIVLLILF